ncbi:uncharacterized protein YMR317W-like [Schistocerca piceifrons]|uniref:uncharacterized protein YMR317W-like n=1 Tax=Schistocerca piceifrons TaxID=274613 RepID=UPI001F5E4783|nr:uncharacterized protein YMR317W-like [Schistocerca piceifrons]
MGSPTILQLLLIVNANIHLSGSAVRDQLQDHHRRMSSDPSLKQRQRTVETSHVPSSFGFTTSTSSPDRQHGKRSTDLENDISNYTEVASNGYYTFQDSNGFRDAYRPSTEKAGTRTKEANPIKEFGSIVSPSKRKSDEALSWSVSLKKFRHAKPATAAMPLGLRRRRDRFLRSVRDEASSPASLITFDTESQTEALSPVEQVSTEEASVQPLRNVPQNGRDYTNSVSGGSGEVFSRQKPPVEPVHTADGDITGTGLRAADRPKSLVNGNRTTGDVYSEGSSDHGMSTSAPDDDNAQSIKTSRTIQDAGGNVKSTIITSRLANLNPNKTFGTTNYTNLKQDKGEFDEYFQVNTTSLSNENSLTYATPQQQKQNFRISSNSDNFNEITTTASEGMGTQRTLSVDTTFSTTLSNRFSTQSKSAGLGSFPSRSTYLRRFNNKDITLFSLIAESADSTLQKPDLNAVEATAEIEGGGSINEKYVSTISRRSERPTIDRKLTKHHQVTAQLPNKVSEEVTAATPAALTIRPSSVVNDHLPSIKEYLWNEGMQNDGPAMAITAATGNGAITESLRTALKSKKPLLYNNERSVGSSRLTVTTPVTPVLSVMLNKQVTSTVEKWSVTSAPSTREHISVSVPPPETERRFPEGTSSKYRNTEDVYTTSTADLSAISAETENEFDFKPTDANLDDDSNETLTAGGNSSTAKSGGGASGNDSVSGWPVKLSAVVEGELVLGGLMMVHERSDTVTCGPVMPQGGVQALETMLYTLDRINAPPSLLPNVTIGAHILDDCDKDTYGLEMAVDFIKGRCPTCT